MIRLALCAVLTLILAGCLGTAPKAPPLRDPDARISSQVNVTADRLAGDWVVRVSWPGTPNLLRADKYQDPSAGHEMSVHTTANGVKIQGFHARSVSSGEVVIAPFTAYFNASGQGRFDPEGNGVFGGAGLWVLWIDADDRTAAIGTPGGEFGWIMDRRQTGGEDRITAAKEIMEWMGYDLSRARERTE